MKIGKIDLSFLRRRIKPVNQEEYALVELRNVVKIYESSAGGFKALKGVDLKIEQGEFVAIVGKSGSGKSTLLNMITGIDRPTSGEIYINRVPIHKLSEAKLTDWRGDTIGIVFQFFQLIPTMTLIENVMLPMDFCNKYSLWSRREKAAQLLEQVSLSENRDRLPAQVSGGQQQRAAIARALANDPPVIVADEPTGNLDSVSAEAVFNLLIWLNEQGKTVIIVTHDLDLAKKCQRIIRIVDGEIADDQTLLSTSPQAAGAETEAGHVEANLIQPETTVQEGSIAR